MAKRRTPLEIASALRERARKIEERIRAAEKAQDAAKQRRLIELIKTAGLYDEDESVVLNVLREGRMSLALHDAIRATVPPAGTPDLMPDPAPDPALAGTTTVPTRPPVGTLLEVAPPGTLTTAEASRLTGRSTASLLKAVHDGRLYAVRVPGRTGPQWRFDRRDVQAYTNLGDLRFA